METTMTLSVADRGARSGAADSASDRRRGGLSRLGGAVAGHLARWSFRHQTRRQLRMLDSRMLNDIGLCRDEALAEALKPFWRA
ncbi:hypothetical protein P409_06145 [Inquilinus limosus MP06]|uniref:YjiS-like domain-containing protein n=2 Tax=Inquilinus limosus TaxID=171674 RepID=A0A0A0DAK3_9PROT|nr:hypothetical protein P409_06145 [Inquilinus limosus MP06]